MATKNTYRTYIWMIVILIATNLSMAISFAYHKYLDKKDAATAGETVNMPSEQRTRFFREQLDLSPEQVEQFRELNRNYNRSARQITLQLEDLRIQMVNEMGQATPDENKLEGITKSIGNLHAGLKQITIDYYLQMKAVCNEQQQKKLNEIFVSISKNNEDVKLPQRGGRHHRQATQ